MLKKITNFPAVFAFIIGIVLTTLIYKVFYDSYKNLFQDKRYAEVSYVGKYNNQNTLDYLGKINLNQFMHIIISDLRNNYSEKECHPRLDGWSHTRLLLATTHYFENKFGINISRKCLKTFNKYFLNELNGYARVKFNNKKIKFDIKYDQIKYYEAPHRFKFIAKPENFALLIFFNIFLVSYLFLNVKKKK